MTGHRNDLALASIAVNACPRHYQRSPLRTGWKKVCKAIQQCGCDRDRGQCKEREDENPHPREYCFEQLPHIYVKPIVQAKVAVSAKNVDPNFNPLMVGEYGRRSRISPARCARQVQTELIL